MTARERLVLQELKDLHESSGLTKGKTYQQIGDLYGGISTGTMYRYIKKGIPPKNKRDRKRLGLDVPVKRPETPYDQKRVVFTCMADVTAYAQQRGRWEKRILKHQIKIQREVD